MAILSGVKAGVRVAKILPAPTPGRSGQQVYLHYTGNKFQPRHANMIQIDSKVSFLGDFLKYLLQLGRRVQETILSSGYHDYLRLCNYTYMCVHIVCFSRDT